MSVAEAIKERPIIFGAESVRAIQEGRKFQTRRVIKPQPVFERGAWQVPGFFCNTASGFAESVLRSSFRCPYGQVGDRLWARECHAIQGYGWKNSFGDRIYVVDVSYGSIEDDPKRAEWHATYEGIEAYLWARKQELQVWRSPIFMPRWASRLTLEITDVRVQRLQGITPEDARAEGMTGLTPEWGASKYSNDADVVSCFAALWDSINGKKHPWESDPWVFVIEFRKVEDEPAV